MYLDVCSPEFGRVVSIIVVRLHVEGQPFPLSRGEGQTVHSIETTFSRDDHQCKQISKIEYPA
jgi:hypothetical protein